MPAPGLLISGPVSAGLFALIRLQTAQLSPAIDQRAYAQCPPLFSFERMAAGHNFVKYKGAIRVALHLGNNSGSLKSSTVDVAGVRWRSLSHDGNAGASDWA
jgi:hypothetical protein